MRALVTLALSGCTLVVGSDPRLETDAGAVVDAASEDTSSSAAMDGALPDVFEASDVATNACDAGGCNATKNACKKVCADNAKQCNDACTPADGKSCHDPCNQQMQACNNACVATCLQCVTGCGTCGP